MKKIVINRSSAGFGISDLAKEILSKKVSPEELKNIQFNLQYRGHAALVAVVESLGDKANASSSFLQIVEIPDDVEWIISSHIGFEWVAEKHRTWSAPDKDGHSEIRQHDLF
jgi:hypothetical protein